MHEAYQTFRPWHPTSVAASQPSTTLILLLLALLTNNVEELQAVLALASAHDAQPVPQLLLLEELLGQVLQVAAREVLVGDDLDATVAEVADGDVVAQVAGAAFDFDALLQKGREGAGVENAVFGGLLGVDDELWFRMGQASVALEVGGQKWVMQKWDVLPSSWSFGPSCPLRG